MKENEMKALFIISTAGFAEDIVDTVREAGIVGATIIHARGAGAPKSFMGITVDAEKEIIFSITNAQTAAKAMAAIKNNHGIDTPARGICFLMPVEKTVGIGKLSNQNQSE